jgi:hypothetical protein
MRPELTVHRARAFRSVERTSRPGGFLWGDAPPRIRKIALPLLLLALVVGACEQGEPIDSQEGAPISGTERESASPESLSTEDEHGPESLESDDAFPRDALAGADAEAPVEVASPGDPAPTPRFERPEAIRGIYLNAWVSGSRARREALMDLARETEINTFVIDVKDATGYVSYETEVALARETGADRELRIHGVRALLRRLSDEGIYPIARIVVFKDYHLAAERPDLAVQDTAGGPWVDGNGEVWVNPFAEEVWAYNVALAREAAEMGFAEIQWDYIRFPDRPASELERAVFPGQGDRTRSQAIRDFLLWSRDELSDLDVPLTGDVFGVAASSTRDVGIGQLWEDLVDAVDAILPMIYPSHYWPGSFGYDEPNAYPYEIVKRSLEYAVQRTEGIEGAGRIIPWIQDFTLGAPPYGPAEVRAQIEGAYDAGVDEWILWNAAGRYTAEALEPRGGWIEGQEPLMRLGGELVPMNRSRPRGDPAR